MSENAEDIMIQKTQEALSKYVKKPPLTEKLLRKPPFRYLHDIVTTIIKETGLLNDVFSPEEMDSVNVKDKETKIAFLDKLIAAVQSATKQKISVRSTKIVAGLEVNKTLELLQLIGKAVDQKTIPKNESEENIPKIDSTKSQQSKNERSKHKVEKKKETKDSSSLQKSTEKRPSQPNVKTLNEKDGKIQKKVASRDKKPPTIEPSGEKSKEVVSNKEKDVPASTDQKKAPAVKNASEKRSNPSKSNASRKSSLKNGSEIPAMAVKSDLKVPDETKEDVPANRTKINQKSKILEKEIKEKIVDSTPLVEANQTPANTNGPENEDNNQNQSEKNIKQMGNEIKKSAKSSVKQEAATPRPGSARPGSRKLHHEDSKHNIETTIPSFDPETNSKALKNRITPPIRPGTASRPPSARPGAPRIRDRGEVSVVEVVNTTENSVNVIEESSQDQAVDDKDSFIIVECENTSATMNEPEEIADTEQGQLVNQILRTQKELHGGLNTDKLKKRLEIENESDRKAGNEVVVKEIEKIRESIQALTGAANPLGKLFDFLQEDVDEMLRELQHWRNINNKLYKEQIAEFESNKSLMQPLLKQLSDIENSIREEHLQIGSIKTLILNNDKKIIKLTTKAQRTN